ARRSRSPSRPASTPSRPCSRWRAARRMPMRAAAPVRVSRPAREVKAPLPRELAMSEPKPIIRAEGLTRKFGDFVAVDNLTIRVLPGTIFAFLGANGSGKSTTIRMLIGLLTPTAGAIEVDAIDVIRHPRRVRDHIGYMGQKVSLYQGL